MKLEFGNIQKCPYCKGKGKMKRSKDDCMLCRGKGYITNENLQTTSSSSGKTKNDKK